MSCQAWAGLLWSLGNASAELPETHSGFTSVLRECPLGTWHEQTFCGTYQTSACKTHMFVYVYQRNTDASRLDLD